MQGVCGSDFLHKLRNGLDVNKPLKMTFVGEPGVDKGSPFSEFLFLLISAISQNNALFSGDARARVPIHNVVDHELERMTYFHFGACLALSIVNGGPAPQFFSPAVASYIAYGVTTVKATIDDIPDEGIKQQLQKASTCTFAYDHFNNYILLLENCSFYSSRMQVHHKNNAGAA